MLGKPIIFLLLNLILFFIPMAVLDYSVSLVISIGMGVFVFLYNCKKVGWQDSIVLAIIYLMIFDSDFFNITPLHLRIWYFFLLIRLLGDFFIAVIHKKIDFKPTYYLYIVTFFLLFSLVYFLSDNWEARLRVVKYWLFSIPSIYILYKSLRNMFAEHKKEVLDFLISIFLFVSIWGIIQVAMRILGLGANFQYFDKAIGTNILSKNVTLNFNAFRPVAFFSESTWYAIYCAMGLILIFYKIHLTKRASNVLLIGLIAVSTILATNRNAYLLIIFIPLTFLFSFILFDLNVEKRIIWNRYYFLLFIAVTGIIIFTYDFTSIYLMQIYDKFMLADASGKGRIDAFKRSFHEIFESPVWGHGFNWEASQVTFTGTYLGSKSFNLFLMILYVFGFIGFVPFVSMLIVYVASLILRLKRIYPNYMEVLISALFLFGFLLVSMFTPMHNMPIGYYFISLSVVFYLESSNYVSAEPSITLRTE